MPTQREFWAQKPVTPVYETITFAHSELGTIRLVNGVFDTVALGGDLFYPAKMDVSVPAQGRDPIPKLRVSFPRISAGRQFTVALAALTVAGRREPITVTYQQWIDGTVTSSFTLWVTDDEGVSMNADSITVVASDDNPMRRNVSIIYSVDVWTGLEQI